MPHTYAKEELEERYKKLPEVLKDAMFSPDVAEKMFEIGKKNGLTIEKTGFMAEETGFVILGLTQPREFVSILKDRLDVSRDTASKIASEINHAVFFPLREALKNTHDIEVNEEELQKEEVVVQKPAPPIGATQDTRPEARDTTPAGEIKPIRSAPTELPPVAMLPKTSAPARPDNALPIQPAPKIQQPTPAPPATPALATPAPATEAPEKNPEIAIKPVIPGFISRQETEKIVAEEKEKYQALAVGQLPAATVAPEKISPPPIPPAAKPAAAQKPIILRPLPQPIPKPSPSIPQKTPEQKNTIDLRQQEYQGNEPMKSSPEPVPQKPTSLPALPSSTPLAAPPSPQPPSSPQPPPARPVVPPPIVIPPAPKPEPLPQEMRPQNPKIQPIDLRGAPVGMRNKESGMKDESLKPQPSKTYEGYDPYREPVE